MKRGLVPRRQAGSVSMIPILIADTTSTGGPGSGAMNRTLQYARRVMALLQDTTSSASGAAKHVPI